MDSGPPSDRFETPDDPAQSAQQRRAEHSAQAPVDTRDVAPPDDRVAGTSFPWPPPENGAIVGAFMQTWQGALFRPTAFYRALTDRTSLGSALLYYLPLGILIAGADLFWRLVRSPAVEQDSTLSTIGAADAAVHPLVWFLLAPLMLLISLFLSAAVTHGLLKLFGGTSRDYGTTTRVFAFAYSPMLFSVVPVIGSAVGFVWMVVVAIIGLREAQHASTGRATAAVLIPVILLLIMIALAYVVRAAGTLLDIPL